MSKLLEILVGIESYQIPEHHQYAIVDVSLEHFDNIITCQKSDPYKTDGKYFFNSVNFAESLILGFRHSVQCLFAPKQDILYSDLEYENLRLARNTFITTKFIDRCIDEFNDMFQASEEPIRRINSAVERADWQDRVSKKIYCIYQLDSLLKMIKDKDLPGEPINFLEIPSTKHMDRHIKELKKEVEGIRKTHKNILDEQFIYRTLHVQYINIFYSKSH